MEAFIDESGSHDGSPVLCLAGYLFESEGVATFHLEWKAMLRRYGLPYFHMVDCAHGMGAFGTLSMEQRIAVEIEAIDIIKQRSLYGFTCTVNESDYVAVFKPLSKDRWSSYYFSLTNCLTMVANYMRRNDKQGTINYRFESGHADQSRANTIMRGVFTTERLRSQFFYGGHSFEIKEKCLPLQAADLLAWQWFTHAKRKLNGATKDRADLIALVRPQDMHLEFTFERLVAAREYAITRDPDILRRAGI
jgi:hypothetical protein